MDLSMPQTNFEKVVAYCVANDIKTHRSGSETLIEELDVCIKSINNLAEDIKEDWTFSNEEETMQRLWENIQDLQLTLYLFWALTGNNIDAMLHDRLKYKVGLTESVQMKGALPESIEKVRDFQVNGGH